jgi:transposase
MDVLHPTCCGIDVHRDSLTACLWSTPPGKKRPTKEVRTYSTFPDDLVRLQQWLQAESVPIVAMEGTGVYWMPVHAALEANCEVVVANAQHIKNVPGRKTDVADSQWLAQLCAHGLLSASFIPEQPIRELRSLTREHALLSAQRATVVNRIHRLLDQHGTKLGSVVSDLQGTTGRAILRMLAAGERDATKMAACARTTLRQKLTELRRSLERPLSEVARQELGRKLTMWDLLDKQLTEVEEQMAQRREPYQAACEKLCEIPGVQMLTATKIIAEIGVDMSKFPTPGRLASWAGLCPGNNESAGKKKSGRTRHGNKHLKTPLVEAALGAARSKGTYLKTKYHQLKSQHGPKKAAVAVAHKLLKIVWHLLTEPEGKYKELGPAYLDRRNQERRQTQLVKRLEAMGLEVTVRTRAAVA